MSLIAVGLAVVVVAGCGGGTSSASTPTTPTQNASSFQGTVAGTTGEIGTIDITVEAVIAAVPLWRLLLEPLDAPVHAQSVSARGTLQLKGRSTPVALSGSYDSGARSVSLSGGGFDFRGSASGQAITGTYSGPSTSGGFSTLSSRSTVTRYCGTYSSSVPVTDVNGRTTIDDSAGVLNVQIDASGVATGTAVSTEPVAEAGSVCQLTGQLAGSSLSLVSCEGGTASLTLQGDTISGSTVSPSGRGTGSIRASTSACR